MSVTLLKVAVASDVVLNVQVEGHEGAPWIVFSNSVLTDLSVWDAQVDVLKEKFRILRYDQRGHGESSGKNAPLNFDSFGEDLLAVIDAVGATDICYVGLSMGVPTGLAAICEKKSVFSKLIFVDGISRSGLGREEFWRGRRDTAQSQGMQALAVKTVSNWLPGVAVEDTLYDSLVRMIASTSLEGFAAATYALSNYDFSKTLEKIDCPVLCIAGELDGQMPITMVEQFKGLSDMRFASISGAGHLPNYQCPALFNDQMMAFIEDDK